MGSTLAPMPDPPIQKLVVNSQTIEAFRSYICVYHDKGDTLFVRPPKAKPAISMDWNGELWIRVDPETKEVVGIEIENFKRIFIKKHPEVAVFWKDIEPICKHRTIHKDDDLWDSFIRVFLQFLASLVANSPTQFALPESPR